MNIGKNFEKYDILKSAHERIIQILSPLSDKYNEISRILSLKKEIIGKMNNNIVRSYGGELGLDEIRNAVDIILNKLLLVTNASSTFLRDVEDCQGALSYAREICDYNKTFLAREIFNPFLNNVEQSLNAFLLSVEGKFSTNIVLVGLVQGYLKKRYPLYDTERTIKISIPMRNEGPGIAQNLTIKIEEMEEHTLLNPEITFSTIEPGDFTFGVNICLGHSVESISFVFIVEWNEIDKPSSKSAIFEVLVNGQRSDIDWDALYFDQPYALVEAEGDSFVGRAEKVRDLASKILRTPMEPFYITGQKRVGKTSLAKAAAHLAQERAPKGNIHYKYLLWGRISHEDPRATLKELGEQIEEFVVSKLPDNIQPFHGQYDGSLSSILKLSDFMIRVMPEEKFVVILDEFDEIHQELYFYGNLAETFFSNIRAITTSKNICIILVGGENMPFIMERQGQKLNKYSRTNLNSFSREYEWDDFECLVRNPTKDTINWHDDAILRIYNLVNGNPYFAKYICSAILRSAIREKDADVTVEEVKRVVDADISTMGANHFAHFWQDGIFKPISEREPEIQKT